MANAPKVKHIRQRKKSESGLTGGPSNTRGVTYHGDHAVQLLLEQISLTLVDPFTPRSIATEPRTIAPNVVRWDIRTDPPETTIEVKYNPKREEFVDWLQLVGESAIGAPGRRFRFIYAEERAAASLLKTVRALIRIAIEVSGDRDTFYSLLAHEEISGADEVLVWLGADAIDVLQKIDLEQLSAHTLDDIIQWRLRFLSTPEESSKLRRYLFDKLQRAAPTRVVFQVRDIVEDLREMGFTLNQPPQIDTQGLPSNIIGALSVLQNCKSGFPSEVLAAVVEMTSEELGTELAPFREVCYDNGLWSLAPLGARVAHPDEVALRARALEELLSYVERHGKVLSAQDQVPNVIALADACLATHPRLVGGVFGILDKLLKEMGQKHLVRDVARLSKAAAQQFPVDRDMKLAMIRSYICGLAWYYQRVGNLEQANVAANKSYRYAKDVDSKVDLAFSAKCTGRLRRLEAEGLEGNERQAKLSESIGMLRRAIEYFSDAKDHGPGGAEVGDCYSLLARTYLVAGEFTSAQENLHRALERIPDDGGKDLIDALIVDGDIAEARGNREDALLRYDKAVRKAQEPGREITEMRARALRQRGRLKVKLGNRAAAELDLKRAAQIWNELGEPIFAAEAEFEMLAISVELSDLPRLMLLKEPATVRLQAIKLHMIDLEAYKLQKTKVAGRRAKQPANYWKNIIKRAHELVGFEGI